MSARPTPPLRRCVMPTVAVARKLAVIMHAMWTDGTCYVGDAAASADERQARATVKDGKLLGAQA